MLWHRQADWRSGLNRQSVGLRTSLNMHCWQNLYISFRCRLREKLIDWLVNKGSGPRGPDAPRLYERALCAPNRNHGSPVALPKLQMAPRPMFLMSRGSRKKAPRCICLSEAQASHSQRTWVEVSSFRPHPLHAGLFANPSRKRCLLRVLCPVRKPVTTLDW
jgi:hypothetical protein